MSSLACMLASAPLLPVLPTSWKVVVVGAVGAALGVGRVIVAEVCLTTVASCSASFAASRVAATIALTACSAMPERPMCCSHWVVMRLLSAEAKAC